MFPDINYIMPLLYILKASLDIKHARYFHESVSHKQSNICLQDDAPD